MPRWYTDEEIAQQVDTACAMEDAGYSMAKIARALEIDKKTVPTRLARRTRPRIERRLEPIQQPEEIERKRKLAKAPATYHNLPHAEIAAILEVPWRTLRIWLSD